MKQRKSILAFLFLVLYKVTYAASLKNKVALKDALTSKGKGVTTQTEIASISNLLTDAIFLQQADGRQGEALPCLLDAYCDKKWRTAADGVVLLLLNDVSGTSYCTGTLIAGPDPNDQLVLTANHCRGQADDQVISTLWAVLVSRETECNEDSHGHIIQGEDTSTTTASIENDQHAVSTNADNIDDANTIIQPKNESPLTDKPKPPYHVVQGLKIVFSDEDSDILILKLLNPIPIDDEKDGYVPYFLGWDASNYPLQPVDQGGVTIHHSSGDLKKLTKTNLPLQPTTWRSAPNYTHLAAVWTSGVTEVGSSGASLLNEDTGSVLGVLTGGSIGGSCSGGRDIFGTLAAAWERGGLWKVLSPDGPEVYRKMQGRYGNNSQQSATAARSVSLVVDPAELILSEGSLGLLQVRLSAPPAPGDTITVSVYVDQQNVVPPRASSSPPVVAVAAITPQLKFTAANWNVTQDVNIIPATSDTNTSVVFTPINFQIVFDLSNNSTSETAVGVYRRIYIPAVYIPLIAQSLPGSSPEDAIIVGEDGPYGAAVSDTGTLAPGRNQRTSFTNTPLDSSSIPSPPSYSAPHENTLATPAGIPLSEFASSQTPGSVKYYNLSTGSSIVLNVLACTMQEALLPVELVLFFNETSVNSTSSESSTVPSTTAGRSCSGFRQLALQGIGTASPYVLAVRAPPGLSQPTTYLLRILQSAGGGTELYTSGDAAG